MNGRNFLMEMPDDDDQIRMKRFGFFTNVFVEANTAEEAEVAAVELLRNDQKLRDATLNGPDDRPMLTAHKIEEVDSFEGRRRPRQGLIFYPENGDGTEDEP